MGPELEQLYACIGGWSTVVDDEQMRSALEAWRKRLIDLTRRNQLIKFKPQQRSVLRLIDPTIPETLAALVDAEARFRIRGTELEEEDGHGPADDDTVRGPGSRVLSSGISSVWRTSATEARSATALKGLKRKADEHFLERGISVLHLAVGLLHWKDIDDTELLSPLLLVPVSLHSRGARSTPELGVGEGERVLNPALRLMLEERGGDLSHLPAPEDASISEIVAGFEAVLRSIEDIGTWSIEESMYLGNFAFSKEAMYRDLKDNESRIIEHPIVRALATTDPREQTDQLLFEPVDSDRIDELAPPEQVPMVLNADSSQRVAIAAAQQGKSFVMDGPPGTGKSQTIANMIATLLHDGKSVLFVSEKIAALDVVKNRLKNVGLESFLFEIHSAKSSRKAVADELSTTLGKKAVPPRGLDEVSLSTLRKRRMQLNAYADASNEVRELLNQSVHDVLGRLAWLTTVPKAPLPAAPLREMSDRDLADLLEAAVGLSRVWRPAAHGSGFLWRGVTSSRPLNREIEDAGRTLHRMEQAAAPHRELLEAVGITDIAEYADALAMHEHAAAVEDREILAQWLSRQDLEEVIEAHHTMVSVLERAQSLDAELHRLSERSCADFPDPEEAPVPPTPILPEQRLLRVDEHLSGQIREFAASMRERASRIEQHQAALSGLASSMGLPEPQHYSNVEVISRLVDIRDQETAPDPRWFTPQGLAEAESALRELEEQHRRVCEAESNAGELYSADALRAPLVDLKSRFETLHTGLFKSFSSAYKQDRDAVRALLKDASRVKEGIDELDRAVEWAGALQQMQHLESVRAGALGRHWQGPRTNYARLRAGLQNAQQVLAQFRGGVPQRLINYLTSSMPNSGVRAMVDSARAEFAQWVDDCGNGRPLAGPADLIPRPIVDSLTWLRGNADHMEGAAARSEWVSRTTGSEHSLRQADAIIAAVQAAFRAQNGLRIGREVHGPLLGFYWGESGIDSVSLDRAIDNANSIRKLHGGPLDERAARRLVTSRTLAEFSKYFREWENSRDQLLGNFDPDRRSELLEDFTTREDAEELLGALAADGTGQQEWVDHHRYRARLDSAGLARAVDFCAETGVDPALIPQIIEQTVLHSWVEDIVENDDRLSPLGALEKDQIVEEFRLLDQQLVAKTAARIIKQANSRRPSDSGIGEPGLIRKEGAKKRKHKAARDLISEARHAVQGLKPVFMMSPLAVSQYLPSDLTFDVVIFDEASQVPPPDAINCIYRGRSLILAGDDKQLPPTSFFDRAVEDDPDDDSAAAELGDFQSVLELASGSGAFKNLGLRWHYRSQHESLIAYSNYKFYGGKLITFPSAQDESAALGVHFTLVENGVYERGGGASNPIEARAVARRVLDHYESTPDITLGVVTFSVAQQEAVEAAIQMELEQRRHLDRYFNDNDRLGGFFVRSLESVQGDERDVILFSVGYGPDEAGKITTSFGPLNNKGGERRLNVGITRARRAVEVFASMTADQIPFSTNKNVELLRNYIAYAEKGVEILAIPASPTGLDPESPFEDSVIQAIQSWGYEVEPQVGAAGYRIDIGVRHPELRGTFALGVECDGFQYHSAPAARDRDRLRDSILTNLGWTMHRIWGTSWYRHRDREEARLREAIEQAVAGRGNGPRRTDLEQHAANIEFEETVQYGTLSRSSSSFAPVLPPWSTEYREAEEIPLPYGTDPSDPDSVPTLVHGLYQLTKAEQPVHLNTVHRRLRGWWQRERIGSRIKTHILEAIDQSPIKIDGDFLYLDTIRVDEVRTPTADNQRTAEEVHVLELALAIEHVVRDAGSASYDEVMTAVRSVFGWGARRGIIEYRLQEATEVAVQDGRVEERGETLLIPREERP